MAQGDGMICRTSTNVLRQRIYATAFDYFTISPQTPTRRGHHLKYDLKQLVAFWDALYTDGRYIKKESFVATESDLNMNLQQILSDSQYNDSNLQMRTSAQTWHGNASSNPNWANTITIVANSQTRSGSTTRITTGVKRMDANRDRDVEHQIKNCLRKRQLLLLLISNEIERMTAWLHPINVDQVDEGDTELDQHLKNIFSDARSDQKQMKETTKFAWDISPELSVALASRFRMHSIVKTTLQDLIRTQQEQVSHKPEALALLLGELSTNYDYMDLSHILSKFDIIQ